MREALSTRERELLAEVARLKRDNDLLRAQVERQGASEAADCQRELEAMRSLIDNAPDVIVRYDRAYRHVYVNRALENATGRPMSAFLGKSNADLGLDPALVRLWHEHIETVFQSGKPQEVEFEFEGPDGRRHYQQRLVPEFDAGGQVASVMSVARDLTELHHARTELAEYENKLAAIINHSPDPVYIKDLDGRIILINQAGSAAFGLPASAVVGRVDADFFPPAVAEQVRADDMAVIATGEPHSIEYDVPMPDGHVTTFLTNKFPFRTPEGGLVGVVGVARDISERKRMEQALRKQTALTTAIVNHVPAGICFIDKALIYRWVNPAFLKLLGVDLAHMLDRSVQEAFPEGADQIVPLHRQVLATGQPYHGVAFPWRYRVGDREILSHWDFTYQPVYDDHGAIQGLLVLAVEVSERVEKDRLLAERIHALEQAHRLKDEFLAVLSHELRTPLNFIMGFASVMDDGLAGDLTPAQAGYVSKILYGSDRLLRLVDDLLDLSRLRAGKLTLHPEALDPAAAVRQALEMAEPAARAKGVGLSLSLPSVLPAVRADAGRFAQVVDNLLTNAVKFTPTGGAVTLEARAEGAWLRVTVSDTGIGIPEDQLARLFEPFTQADMSATREVGGLGLGLSIVKALVEAHGGRVGVTSRPGEGSAFWFTMPLA